MRTQHDPNGVASATMGLRRFKSGMALGLLLSLCATAPWSQAEDGITDKTIRVGAYMPLEGDNKFNALALKLGIEAALANQLVQGRRIEYAVINDFYDPAKSVEATRKLIDQGIFLMLGAYGSAAMKAVLPVLADQKIPAVGFYTGAAFTEPGDVLNFRASYAIEVESAINAALAAGVKPAEVCAYAENNTYGMSGINGLRMALAKLPGAESIITKLRQILDTPGDNPERNHIGPVGVYEWGTINARNGYLSLKKWEETSGYRCRLVMMSAVYAPAANFMAYARFKGEPWVFSTLSILGSNQMKELLQEKGITDKVITTQIVPALDSALPVVAEARKALGNQISNVSLEGYIVGKLFIAIMRTIEGPLTRENFLKAAHRQPYDIGGFNVDFTTGSQGSNFVLLTHLKDGDFAPVKPGDLELLFKQ
jgi:branched-chain amino acid transport system substrate-binding protein